jgi:hypothetical protein
LELGRNRIPKETDRVAMANITIRPKWEWKTHPCPKCGENTLEYDGSVKWRSGPRPGRNLATKRPVGFSPRADFEIAHYFHCASCERGFYDPVDTRRPRLFVERDAAEKGS